MERGILGFVWVTIVLVLPSASAEPLKVVLVSGSFEYESAKSLARFEEYLNEQYDVETTLLSADGWWNIPGLDALRECDVALFFTRRLRINGEQLNRIKEYSMYGNPIVAVRTASHGFQNWLRFDNLVLGGNYQNHYEKGPATRVTFTEAGEKHPVMEGVEPIESTESLYKNTPVADDVTVLQYGETPEAREPVTWVRDHNGGRVFYTSLGGTGDFENPAFQRMLANALFWTARREAQTPKRKQAAPKVLPHNQLIPLWLCR